jgi:hypothetical protein
MFDGERAQPEQRVSLLLRINPRRYDPVLAAAVHRLLAALPASEAGAGDTPQHSIARLLRLADQLERWRETSEAIAPGLDGAHGALLVSMNEQHATLQRMLYDAGVTHEQLGALGDDIEADAPRSCFGSCTRRRTSSSAAGRRPSRPCRIHRRSRPGSPAWPRSMSRRSRAGEAARRSRGRAKASS